MDRVVGVRYVKLMLLLLRVRTWCFVKPFSKRPTILKRVTCSPSKPVPSWSRSRSPKRHGLFTCAPVNLSDMAQTTIKVRPQCNSRRHAIASTAQYLLSVIGRPERPSTPHCLTHGPSKSSLTPSEFEVTAEPRPFGNTLRSSPCHHARQIAHKTCAVIARAQALSQDLLARASTVISTSACL